MAAWRVEMKGSVMWAWFVGCVEAGMVRGGWNDGRCSLYSSVRDLMHDRLMEAWLIRAGG